VSRNNYFNTFIVLISKLIQVKLKGYFQRFLVVVIAAQDTTCQLIIL